MAQKGTQMDWVIAFIGLLLVGGVGWIALNLSTTQTVVVSTTSPTDTGGQPAAPVTGATSTELQDVAYDYDRNQNDASAQYSVRTNVNASIWKVDTLTSILPTYLAHSTTYSIGDTNPVGSRGTTYRYVPVDASYAVLEKELITVTPTTDPVPVVIPVHNLTAEQNLQWTCYDKDTNSLNAGSNTSQWDYNLTLSANVNANEMYCWIAVTASDSAYALGSILTLYENDIDNFYPSSIEFAGTSYGFDCTKAVPLHAQNLAFNTAGEASVIKETGWKKRCDVKGGPLTLYGDGSSMATTSGGPAGDHRRAKVWFMVDTSGTDPTFVTSTSSDMFCAITKDTAPYNKQRGGYAFDIADDSDSQADIGLDELDTAPLGKQSGFCTAGI